MGDRAPLPPDFCFDDRDREALLQELEKITINPYREYPAFLEAIRHLIARADGPPLFYKECARARHASKLDHPFHFLRNSPIDRELPIFDMKTPVESKYELKKTFIGEAFLILYSELLGTPAIGYKNVNSGDIVHDIYPKEELYNTQSQKTLAPIGFHKDLANHFVRPDHVNILSMRSYPGNEIFTTFVRNLDLLDELRAITDLLRRPDYYTPYDDLSTYGDKANELGQAKPHAILLGDHDFVYFEGRTRGADDEGNHATAALDAALHRRKTSVLMRPGDFVSIANNHSLHGKDVETIRDPHQQKIRWSIKTVNVDSLAKHTAHYVPGHYGLVNG